MLAADAQTQVGTGLTAVMCSHLDQLADADLVQMLERIALVDLVLVVSAQENIQEHSHMVAVIAHALGVIRRDVMGVPCDPNEAAVVALFHDSSEILTGDLPTPIKYHSEEIKGAYRQVENLACNMLLDTLPDELRGAYEPLLTGETQERLHDIVKAADKLSAYIKCIEERKAGNNEFLSAEKQNREQLEANPLPEGKYFMEHFIPAFELTLDELGTIG